LRRAPQEESLFVREIGMSFGGPEVRSVVRHKGFAAPQVSVSAATSSEPAKLSRR
jgi:hypothetical protein